MYRYWGPASLHLIRHPVSDPPISPAPQMGPSGSGKTVSPCSDSSSDASRPALPHDPQLVPSCVCPTPYSTHAVPVHYAPISPMKITPLTCM